MLYGINLTFWSQCSHELFNVLLLPALTASLHILDVPRHHEERKQKGRRRGRSWCFLGMHSLCLAGNSQSARIRLDPVFYFGDHGKWFAALDKHSPSPSHPSPPPPPPSSSSWLHTFPFLVTVGRDSLKRHRRERGTLISQSF